MAVVARLREHPDGPDGDEMPLHLRKYRREDWPAPTGFLSYRAFRVAAFEWRRAHGLPGWLPAPVVVDRRHR